MDTSSLSFIEEDNLTIEEWPASLESTRQQLKKAQTRLERYRAALRLAGSEIDQRNRGIISLTTFAYQASRTVSLATLLRLALVQALESMGAPVGTIILIDMETKALTLGVHKGLTPELIQVLTGQELNHGATALMPHLVTGAGALLEEASTDDETERQLLATGKVSSLVSLPLQVGPRLLGAFLIGLRKGRCFKPAELCFLMAISQEIALALESVRLREGVWHTAELLLGGDASEELVEMVDEVDLMLEAPTPFDLPAAPAMPQPADEDLEQLLAAMMEAEDEVQQQNADLQMLNTIAERINSTLNLKDILQCAVDQARSILQTSAAWVYLADENNHLEMEAHTGLSQTYVRGMHRLQVGDGLEGWIVAHNQARFIDNVTAEGQTHKIWVDKEGLRTLAAVPITRPQKKQAAGSQVVGVLAIGKQAADSAPWTPREIRLLTSIANQLALAIDNARLYAQVQENEVSMRTGNEVLRTINDMLLEKNVFLEGFIKEDLVPLLATAAQTLQELLTPETELAEAQQQQLASLQTTINRLRVLSKETGDVSRVLDTEFTQAVDRKSQATDSVASGLVGPARPKRLEKSPSEICPIPATPPPPPGEPSEPQQALSFEEAVAAGLVPDHLLHLCHAERRNIP